MVNSTLAKFDDTEVHLLDSEYPRSEITRHRYTVRAIAVNDHDEVAMLRIEGADFFGFRQHLESPGGGIEPGETVIDTLSRELQEELGYSVSFTLPLGRVAQDYHLLQATHHATYFLVRVGKKIATSRTPEEQALIQDIVWMPIQKLLHYLRSNVQTGAGHLIHIRERLMIERAIQQLPHLPKE